jgi:hypothetical protein
MLLLQEVDRNGEALPKSAICRIRAVVTQQKTRKSSMGFKMAAAAENQAGRNGLRFWFSFLLEPDGEGA